MKRQTGTSLIIVKGTLIQKYHICDFVNGRLWSRRERRWLYGWSQGRGYQVITLDNSTSPIHRCLYECYHGVSLKKDQVIDHIDGNRANNCILNLRVTDNRGNSQNRKTRCDSKTGVKGVSISKSGKAIAVITVNGKRKHLGSFNTIEEAKKARLEAEIEANKNGAIFGSR